MTFLPCSPLAFMQGLWFKVGFPEYSLPEVIFCPWMVESLLTELGCVALEKNTEEDGDVACESQGPNAINTDG